ncbi:MAG TPA: 1-acyl-sn-glycerol-3-phosphate acyltransferase, partial [Methyloceanibacter sp.]
RPGTIIVEFLDPIPPGLPRTEFLARLTSAIETASDRLLAEANPKESGSMQGVNL